MQRRLQKRRAGGKYFGKIANSHWKNPQVVL
jgi:hypothetical protein